MSEMNVKVEINLSYRRIADLICCAIEGGIGYWACLTEVGMGKNDVKPWDDDYTPDYIAAPLCTDGFVKFIDEEDDNKEYILNRETIEKGFNIMRDKHAWHFANFMSENEDSITGDVFAQCCLLGDVVYG